MAEAEKRAYIILEELPTAVLTDPDLTTPKGEPVYTRHGEVMASGSEQAIRLAVGELSLGSGNYVAVTKRSWFQVPVTIEQEPRIKLGDQLAL